MDNIKKKEGFTSQKLFVLSQMTLDDLTKHPLIKPLYMTDIGYFSRALHHYRDRPDGCSSYIIIYCASGNGWFKLKDQKKLTLTKGFVVVLPADVPHEYGAEANDPWSIYWLHIKGDHLLDYISEAAIGQSMPISIEKTLKLEQFFNECYTILERGYTLTNMIYISQIIAHLLAFLFIYQGLSPVQQNKNSFIMDRVVQIMIDHLESTLSLQDLSEKMHLSKPHLTHLFKKHSGYAPIDYYLRLKIQRACQYLDLTSFTLKDISAKLGFSDPYYFSRLFRKIMGQSPSIYRKNKKG